MRNDNISVSTTANDSTTDEGSWVGSFINLGGGQGQGQGNTPAAAGISLSVRPKHEIIGTGSNLSTSQMCLTMKAPELLLSSTEDNDDDNNKRRSPVAITVILDVSGSMHGQKLRLCKRTLDLLLRMLTPEDYFCLVSFSSGAKIDVPIQKMTPTNKERASTKVKALRAGGSTNMSAAIGLGFQEMRAVEDPNVIRAVFLLTDGQANTGICRPRDLAELTRNCLYNGDVGDDAADNMDIDNPKPAPAAAATDSKGFFSNPWSGHSKKPATAADDDVADDSKPAAAVGTSKLAKGALPTLFCFGYGSDHNATLLQQLSSIVPGTGSYYFVEDEEHVGTAFGDALGGIMSVVAQNVVATIRVPPEAAAMGVTITQVFHDQAIRRADGHYTVNAGDFYAEESRDIVFETTIAVPAQGAPASVPIPHAAVTLAYTDAINKMPVTAGPVVCALSRPSGDLVSPADDHVSAQWVRVFAVRRMEEANKRAEANDLAAARAAIAEVKELVAQQEKRVREHAEVEHLAVDLDELEVGLQSRSVYAERGHAHFARGTQQYRTQRCNASTLGTSNAYFTSAKKKHRAILFGSK